jgi:hypothetical protein
VSFSITEPIYRAHNELARRSPGPDAGVNLFDFFFDLVAFGARRFELRIEFGSFLFQLLDVLLIGLGISLLLDGMVVLITRFFQLALDEFDFLVDLLEANRRSNFLRF